MCVGVCGGPVCVCVCGVCGVCDHLQVLSPPLCL